VRNTDAVQPTNVTIEDEEKRLKVVVAESTNWPSLAIYSFGVLIWLAMLVTVLSYLVRGLSSSAVLTTLLVIWIFIWLGFGRFLFSRWQFYLANREILFIDEQQLIIRRPVSIFGLTTAYEWQHVSRFYYSDKHQCLAFDYAFAHVYFGRALKPNEAKELVTRLNGRLFPEPDEDLDNVTMNFNKGSKNLTPTN